MPPRLGILYSLIFSLFGITLLFPSAVAAFSGSGLGTSGSPFQIASCSQLMEMDNNVTAYYQQKNDIDCTGVTFTPIGRSPSFSGTFDGGGYTISNLTITGVGVDTYALFGSTDGATIRNSHIVGGSISAPGEVASFVGFVAGDTTLQFVSSTMSLTETEGYYVGGLIGYVQYTSGDVTIENSSFSGTINSAGSYMGGLIADLHGITNSISNSYSSGTYTIDSGDYVGGLVGLHTASELTITNSYSNAVINFTNSGSAYVGGLVSNHSSGPVTNSFSAVTISGTVGSLGGIFGLSNVSPTNTTFDAYLAGTTSCTGTGSATCTGVNSGNSNPNYFKGNSSSSPLSSWNFSTIWQTVSGNYPTLHPFGYTAPSSAPLSSPSGAGNSSVPSCADQKPGNAPNLFQIDVNNTNATLYFVPVSNANKYYIRYGIGENANQYGIEFSSGTPTGVLPYSIMMLSPNTTYSFVVRGGNGCMPGEWGNTMQVKTGRTSTSSVTFYKNFPSRILSILPKQMTNAGSSGNTLGVTTSAVNNCQEYTVKFRDNLWSIASQNLGTGAKYTEIMQKNSLSSTLLYLGQVLKIGC